MSATGQSISDIIRIAEAGSTRLPSLVAAAAILQGMAWLAPNGIVQMGLAAASVTIAVMAALAGIVAWFGAQKRNASIAAVTDFIEHDSAPSFVTTLDGEILHLNSAAQDSYPADPGETLAGALRSAFANPGGIILRLNAKVEEQGSAREDIVTRKGHLRIAVHQMNSGANLWRIEPVTDQGGRVAGDGPALPMIMVGRTGAVLYMNEAARGIVGQRVTTLDKLFLQAPPSGGQVCDLATKDGVVKTLVAEVDAGAGRKALYMLPAPDYAAPKPWTGMEDSPLALLDIDEGGRVVDYNASARELVGEALEHGVAVTDLMLGLGRPLEDWLEETRAGRAVQTTEFLRLKKNPDKETFVQVALKAAKRGDQTRLVAVLTDATELKTLEARFVQSQKMQAIGQLAGGVAHDFNNLLTAISGHCDLLLLRHDAGDADYADLMQINQNANRAAALVGQLLAFSRKQNLRAERLDLRDTLADLTHLLNRLVGEKVTLTLSHDPVLPPIRADKRQLEQVLMNLVVNARDAMPGGGEIRVETERLTLLEPLERDRVTVPEGPYVCLRVTDEGVGIAKDKLQKVFEPFFTTKRAGEGTGLGLSTAYGIVKQTGGFIFVDSEVGHGTCFTLMFPVVETSASKMPIIHPSTSRVEPKHGDGVILLVEDEAPVRAFASRALRLRGYTVLEADSAETALKTLEDESLSVDLFVTDVVMPGKDGPSWVREALKDRPDVRVVFVSGYAEDRLSSEKTQIPNSVFLPKPFSLNDLAETVHNQLH